ncbi:MAG: ATP-binding protein [Clostridia bacterium]|nr:ATP-binding protein [Clostridia bacterium]
MFNRENYKRIKQEFTAKHLAAGETQRVRMREVEAGHPEMAEINAALSQTGLRIFEAAMAGREGLEQRIAKLRDDNRRLLDDRAALLTVYGYPADYLDLKYECSACMDTGFIDNGTRLCTCMRRALVLAGYESSGIGPLLERQTFENFSLQYYTDPADRRRMEQVLETARRYVGLFSDEKSQNLLFFGQTGLGKTHLSSAIAKSLIDRGFDVLYETAQNLFGDFEDEKFNRAYNTGVEERKTDRYFSCDLLIIDDLGAELSNQFTASCLYNLINTRYNMGKSCIISTNLTHPEIEKRYSQRVLSRLLGQYQNLQFTGRDIRMMKKLVQ